MLRGGGRRYMKVRVRFWTLRLWSDTKERLLFFNNHIKGQNVTRWYPSAYLQRPVIKPVWLTEGHWSWPVQAHSIDSGWIVKSLWVFRFDVDHSVSDIEAAGPCAAVKDSGWSVYAWLNTSERSSASFLSILVRAPSSSSRSSDMRPSSSWCTSFSKFSCVR